MSSVVLSRLLVDIETLDPEERDVLRAKLELLASDAPLDPVERDELLRRVGNLRDGTALLHDHEDVRRDFLRLSPPRRARRPAPRPRD
jgi:hypothetical protein